MLQTQRLRGRPRHTRRVQLTRLSAGARGRDFPGKTAGAADPRGARSPHTGGKRATPSRWSPPCILASLPGGQAQIKLPGAYLGCHPCLRSALMRGTVTKHQERVSPSVWVAAVGPASHRGWGQGKINRRHRQAGEGTVCASRPGQESGPHPQGSRDSGRLSPKQRAHAGHVF